MKLELLYHLFLFVVVSNLIIVMALTQTRETDVLNLNGIQDGDAVTERGGGKAKDAAVTESQENRSFFKPEADRRGGSFYPSGPPLSPGISGPPGIHTSGNGYSYGAPSAPSDYPFGGGGGFAGRPSSPSGHTGYGAGLGGSFPLGGAGGGGFSLGGAGGGSYPHAGGGGGGYPVAGGGGGQSPHHHAMALKGLLLPIAGVALLGAAAVLAKSNPVLLQLGVVSGKRRRRYVEYPVNPYVRPDIVQ